MSFTYSILKIFLPLLGLILVASCAGQEDINQARIDQTPTEAQRTDSEQNQVVVEGKVERQEADSFSDEIDLDDWSTHKSQKITGTNLTFFADSQDKLRVYLLDKVNGVDFVEYDSIDVAEDGSFKATIPANTLNVLKYGTLTALVDGASAGSSVGVYVNKVSSVAVSLFVRTAQTEEGKAKILANQLPPTETFNEVALVLEDSGNDSETLETLIDAASEAMSVLTVESGEEKTEEQQVDSSTDAVLNAVTQRQDIDAEIIENVSKAKKKKDEGEIKTKVFVPEQDIGSVDSADGETTNAPSSDSGASDSAPEADGSLGDDGGGDDSAVGTDWLLPPPSDDGDGSADGTTGDDGEADGSSTIGDPQADVTLSPDGLGDAGPEADGTDGGSEDAGPEGSGSTTGGTDGMIAPPP